MVMRYDKEDGRLQWDHRFVAGLDVGQINDPTAFAVVEVIKAYPTYPELPDVAAHARAQPIKYHLRALERFPLHMRYPEQVRRVAELMRKPQIPDAQLYMDRGGVGLGPFDMLKEARVRNLHGVMITAASAEATQQPYGWNVGKSELVNKVLILMQTKQLQFEQSLPEVGILENELLEFQAKFRPSGSIDFNAREGQHDDLVLAVALAVFGATRPVPIHSLDVRFAA